MFSWGDSLLPFVYADARCIDDVIACCRPVHPNSTGARDPARNGSACGPFSCCEGCLYDIIADPTEHDDLRLSMPALYATMHGRLMKLANTTYQTTYIEPGIQCLTPQQAKVYYKGFRGPYCFNTSNVPVVPTPPPSPRPTVHTFQLQITLKSRNREWCLSGLHGLGVAACTSSISGDSAGAGAGADSTAAAAGSTSVQALTPQWQVGDPKTGELEYAASDAGLCIKLHEETGWNCANTPGTNATEAFLGHCSSGGSGSGAHKTNYFFTAPASASGAGDGDTQVLVKSHDCPTLCLALLPSVDDSDDGIHGSDSLAKGAPGIGLAPCSGDAASVTWQQVMTPNGI